MTALLLGVVGMAEAVVYQGRYRATHGSPLAAGAWTLAVCLLRVGFVCLGVSAAMKDQWAAALVAYAVPAAAVTAWVRACEIERRTP